MFGEAARIAEGVGRRINACASEVNRAMVRLDMGELDGIVETLERAVHTLTLEGSAMAPGAAVILGTVFYAQGKLDKAARTVDAAFDMVGDASYLPAVESVRMEQSHFAAIRGRLAEARERLDHARRIADSRDHLLGRVQVACQEGILQCFLGDIEAATAAARTACELAAKSGAAITRREPAEQLSEGILYGLPLDAVPPSGDDEWAAALRAFGDPSATITLPETLPGRRRATFAVIGALLSSEAARRANEPDRARQLAGEALEKAEALGHVWLEACALRQSHELTGETEYAERGHALVWRIADGLETAEEKRRLMDAWAAPLDSSG